MATTTGARRGRWLAAAIVLCTACSAASAQRPADESQWTEQAIKAADGWLNEQLELPSLEVVDAESLAQARGLLTDLRERLRPAWASYARDQWRNTAPDGREGLWVRLHAYVLNEVARREVLSLELQAERELQAVWRQPGFCRLKPETPFGETVFAISRVPAERRTAVWQALRQAWLEDAASAPATPSGRSALDVETDTRKQVELVRSGHPNGLPPMPPLVAWQWLVSTSDTQVVGCNAMRWWLEGVTGNAGVDVADVGRAYRAHAMKEFVLSLVRDSGDYPKLATRFGVEGTVKVVGTAQQGRLRALRIGSREVSVPGLEGMEPVFFKYVFDLASLHQAARTPVKVADGQQASLDLVWRLE